MLLKVHFQKFHMLLLSLHTLKYNNIFGLQVLGTYKFHELAHHVVIGNQVIIRSYNKATVKSMITVLKVSLNYDN